MSNFYVKYDCNNLLIDVKLLQFIMPKFIFFDINDKHVKAHRKTLANHIPNSSYVCSDVRQLEADIYVSPANSYGCMDGGIDEIYMEMFEGIEDTVQNEIRRNCVVRNIYDRATLGIGSALVVKTNKENKFLICAPTMFVPQNIQKHPDNVYFAMCAILRLCDILKLDDSINVAIPGLGTGVGGLTPEESAQEILRAYYDYKNQSIKYPDNMKLIHSDTYYLIVPN